MESKQNIFYFGDEHCVQPDHQDTNYGMERETLDSEGIPTKCTVVRIEAELSDRKDSAMSY